MSFIVVYFVTLYKNIWKKMYPGILVSSTNKTDCHDVTEILLKVAINTITPTPPLIID